MTKVIYREGDIFSTDAVAIGHGVNIVGYMASGIAPFFKQRYPTMYSAYHERCVTYKFQPGNIFVWLDPNKEAQRYVYNISSQDKPGANARLIWLEQGVEKALADADLRGIDRIALPRIGAGIGGLEWDDVRATLESAAAKYNCDIELWTLPAKVEVDA